MADLNQNINNVLKSQMSPFSVAQIPQHVHNGVDAPYVQLQTAVYTGYVQYDGSPILLPAGWSVSYDSGTTLGAYTLKHNLGTPLYTCVASATDSLGTISVPIISAPFQNEITISWFESDAGFTRAETSFMFVLIRVKNTLPNVYNYTYSL